MRNACYVGKRSLASAFSLKVLKISKYIGCPLVTPVKEISGSGKKPGPHSSDWAEEGREKLEQRQNPKWRLIFHVLDDHREGFSPVKYLE